MTAQQLEQYTPRPDLSPNDNIKLQRAIDYFKSGEGDVIADYVFLLVLQKYATKGDN